MNKASKIMSAILFFAILSLFSACGGNGTEEGASISLDLNFQDLLDTANERRLGIHKPDIQAVAELVIGRPPLTIDLEQLARPSAEGFVPDITAENAIYDARLLFEILRQYYGAYTYFGGDEVFLPVRDYVLETIAAQEYWTASRLQSLLNDSLVPYIFDTHLFIGVPRFHPGYEVYSTERRFGRSENGFLCGRAELYVREAVGHDINTVFRLAADAEGNLFYSPVIVSREADGRTYDLTIVFENGSREVIPLARRTARHSSSVHTSFDRMEDIPVITLRQMGFDHNPAAAGNAAREFLSLAEEVRNEPAVIIDLRENMGGNGALPAKWLHDLTGEFVPSNNVRLAVGSYEDIMARWQGLPPESPFYVPFDELQKYQAPEPFGDNHVIKTNRPDRMVPSEQILVFLVGRATASAAEGFIDMALNLENTFIIGQNTMGTLITDLSRPQLFLPHSRIHFGLGSSLMIVPEAAGFREGAGFAPDLWVHNSNDALPAALALLRKHFGE